MPGSIGWQQGTDKDVNTLAESVYYFRKNSYQAHPRVFLTTRITLETMLTQIEKRKHKVDSTLNIADSWWRREVKTGERGRARAISSPELEIGAVDDGTIRLRTASG